MDPRILELPEDHPRRIAMLAREEARTSSPEGVQREVTIRVQNMLDAFAKTRGYDSIISAASYASSAVPQFAAEAATCVAVRDAMWGACYAIMSAVQAGTRPLPTIEAVIAELPPPSWD